MSITHWFDITNLDHLRAYKHLCIAGSWPEGFIPDNVEMTQDWSVTLAYSMANAYVSLKLG